MNFYLRKTSTPSTEPVTLSELKTHLKLSSGTAEDSYLTSLITAAREVIEQYTGQCFIQSSYQISLPDFISQIELPYAATNTTVTSFSYTTTTGATGLPSTDYLLVTDAAPANLVMKTSFSRPAVTLQEDAGVQISYTTGATSASLLPLRFKQAVLILAASLYENREGLVKGLPSAVTNLLNSDRISTHLSYIRVE